MNPGDVCYLPCSHGTHWVRHEIARVEVGWRGHPHGQAESSHICREMPWFESRWITPGEIAQAFTPDLPLPPDGWCGRCAVPCYRGRNLADVHIELECCDRGVYQCTHCVAQPWEIAGDTTTSYEQWLREVHAPVCGSRCHCCNKKVEYAMTWRCVGCGTHEQRACAPIRCDDCFAMHRLTCRHRIYRSADYQCPTCHDNRVEYVGGERRCAWCGDNWQAYYLNDPRFDSDLEQRA